MAPYLLDVNVLLALFMPTHVHHEAAHRWFAKHAAEGWATCPITQLGFLRLSMQPAVVKVPLLFADAVEGLTRTTSSELHSFWPIEFQPTQIRPEIRDKIVSAQQLTDGMLIEVALRNGGTLATFDQKIKGWAETGVLVIEP
jgi:uncharacterized protein